MDHATKCRGCGVELPPREPRKPGRAQVWCSRACCFKNRPSTAHEHARRNGVCEECGASFTAEEWRRNQRFCSARCREIAAGRRRLAARDPRKHRARLAIRTEKRAGRLVVPDACERCGRAGRVQAHHEDYDKPLDVEWLCGRCHHAAHG